MPLFQNLDSDISEFPFEKRKIWKYSIELVKEIYLLTQSYPKIETYGLTSQIRRAAVSIPSNIAEGLSRHSTKEKGRFSDIARSSLVELDTQIEISLQLNYLELNSIDNLSKLSNSIFAMLTKLINNYR